MRVAVIRRWLIGLCGAWICVWIAGPWLVNSILVRNYNPALGVITLREGDVIRWRSEGWATTHVGSHGLPGWDPNGSAARIVIWGDSQVEGFCVDDKDKLHRRIIQFAQEEYLRSIDCIPIGRSGTDAVDWSNLIDRADDLWRPIAHVWVVTELEDLSALVEEPGSSPIVDRWQAESPRWVQLAKALRAEAAFQAARNLVFDSYSGGLRSLRFSLGPLAPAEPGSRPVDNDSDQHRRNGVASQLAEINRRLGNRLLLVYAPAVPRVMDQVISMHPDDDRWNALRGRLVDSEIAAIDLRETFIEHWTQHGEFARGFHNGSPSYGHLNALGNRLIAAAICDHLFMTEQGTHQQVRPQRTTGKLSP